MNAKQITEVTRGNYFSRNGGREEIVAFRSDMPFALEMQREAVRTYGGANVNLETLPTGWRLTMTGSESQDETEALRAEFDKACRANI